MKLTAHEKRGLVKKSTRRRIGRPKDPNSKTARAKELGLNRMTYTRLLRKVEAGEMTMEELKNYVPKTRVECGRMAAKARWGGTK